MDQQENSRKITAVIPAYNEAERLGLVLEVVASYPGFHEVIVVDDGSTDGTAEVAARHGVRVLRNAKNLGKGRAIERGINAGKGEIIFCSDADVTGLTHAMIDDIVGPVRNGEADMFIGLQGRPIFSLRPILLFTPLLGGERAFTRDLWMRIPQEHKERFRMETALNFYALHTGKSFRCRSFPGLRQTTKEQKYGFWQGFFRRVAMIIDICTVNLELHLKPFSVSVLRERLMRSFSERFANLYLK